MVIGETRRCVQKNIVAVSLLHEKQNRERGAQTYGAPARLVSLSLLLTRTHVTYLTPTHS